MLDKENSIGHIKYIREKSLVSTGEIQFFPIILTGSSSNNTQQKSDFVNKTFYQTEDE